MKKLIVLAAAVLAVSFISVKSANAQYGCSDNGQYGGCPTPESIMIDKTVGKVISTGSNSATIQYVDNLSENDPKFKAGDFVYFQLRVKNTSDKTENNIRVDDFVPSYLDPVEGPGTFDSNARKITFFISSLTPGQETTYTLKMQVKSNDQLNAINGGVCENNEGAVAVDTVNDADTAQFCVTKTAPAVMGVTQVPSTGPENWIAVVMASVASIGIGVALKRKAH